VLRTAAAALLSITLVAAAASAQEREAPAGFEIAVDGFDFAVNLAVADDGTMFVAERRGEILLVRDGRILPDPFATIDVDASASETGLLGLALHPAFPDEPWVYAYFSDGPDLRNRLARFRAAGDEAGRVEVLLDLLPSTAGYHNGGDMVFGADGRLYLVVGEAHRAGLAQDPDALGGRVLRLEDDGSIPRDNPFGATDPTYALGIRNSFGLCVDPESGELWETENGPSAWDEINRIEAGANYGWPDHLGPGGPDRFVEPVLAFEQVIVPTGCATAGMDVAGGLYFGDFGGALHRMEIPGQRADDRTPTDELVAEFEEGITDVAFDTDGRLWVVTPSTIYRRISEDELPSTPSPTAEPSATPAEPSGPSPTTAASPSASPTEAGDQLPTGPGIAIAVVLIGLVLWLRSRLDRR
jgi:glucose/arabinose dehydrogenase